MRAQLVQWIFLASNLLGHGASIQGQRSNLQVKQQQQQQQQLQQVSTLEQRREQRLRRKLQECDPGTVSFFNTTIVVTVDNDFFNGRKYSS